MSEAYSPCGDGNHAPMSANEAISLLRDACKGWPQPNAYDSAVDAIEVRLMAERARADRYRNAYFEIQAETIPTNNA